MFKSKSLSRLPNVRHAFSGRDVSQMPAELFLAKQIHGDTIIRVDRHANVDEIALREADAIWTTDVGVTIGVKTADCAPLLLADKEGRGVMAVHLGWRGTAMGLAQKSVEQFCLGLGVSPEDVVAAIGPCIGFGAFEVGQEVVDALTAQVSSDDLVVQNDDVHYHVDLQGWIERLLRGAGVIEIEKLGLCTFSDAQKFFSYRRAKDLGRQLSVIALNS